MHTVEPLSLHGLECCVDHENWFPPSSVNKSISLKILVTLYQEYRELFTRENKLSGRRKEGEGGEKNFNCCTLASLWQCTQSKISLQQGALILHLLL